MRKNKLCCLIILMIGGFSFGQQTKKTELVTFRESGFSGIVTEIFHSAYREGVVVPDTCVWYVKRLKVEGDGFLVTFGDKHFLLQSPEEEENNIYVSVIDNKVVLYMTPKDDETAGGDWLISETGFVIDLENYVSKELIILFADYPLWVVKREINGDYSIVRRVKY